MNDSILNSIKKMLGIDSAYTAFDTDIIININSVFQILYQLGVGPDDGFTITGASETWSQYLNDNKLIELVKSYMYMKVRLIFDPPTGSAMLESMKNLVNEFEYRINIMVDPGVQKGES